MNRVIQCFPPIADAQATRLILGSMPGVASLAAGQYYAHPQNAFWRIMGELLNFAPNAPYSERVTALQRGGIAVWDVLQCCERPGSLDSAIVRGSEVANKFADFLRRHPDICTILFNGAAAEAAFRRHCRTLLDQPQIRFVRLPSTSPANAGVDFQRKLSLWRNAIVSEHTDPRTDAS